MSRKRERGREAGGWRLGARILCALALLSISLAVQSVQAADDFLPPQEAYKYSLRAEGDQIFVSWTIAPGYYLYKNKMGVASSLSSVQLGEPKWPRGEDHEDEYFGAQEIYRGKIEVPVPINAGATRPATVPIELKLQGCADAGLCYPPLTWKSEVSLPAPAASTSGRVRSLFSSSRRSSQEEFLPPDEAFRFGASMLRPDASPSRGSSLRTTTSIGIAFRSRLQRRMFSSESCRCPRASKSTTNISAMSRCTTRCSKARCRSHARRARRPARSI